MQESDNNSSDDSPVSCDSDLPGVTECFTFFTRTD